MLKRAADVAISLTLLACISPVLLIIAGLIKVFTPGPVFYTQTRVGLNGKLFKMLKFRTMVVGADTLVESLRTQNEVSGPVFKIKDDPRITPLGKFLRLHSLDELPQFFNVLQGSMAIVGPRPAIPSEVAKHESWCHLRLKVKPGLTCIWQTHGRHNIPFNQWMLMDLEYISKQNLMFDLYLIFKTIPAIIHGHGTS